MILRLLISSTLRAHGRISFLSKLPPQSKILDVGCGNSSPFYVKQVLPKCEYTGIDVCDYNQSKPNLADHYIVTSPNNFTSEISKLSDTFDAVISSHNLEHCDDRSGTLKAMLSSLKVGGQIYISFPCEDSVSFPSRCGTLNYFDDVSHKSPPPNFHELLETLRQARFEIIFKTQHYKPNFLWLLGLFCEPFSAYKRKLLPGTWEYYGFESIIWAKKTR